MGWEHGGVLPLAAVTSSGSSWISQGDTAGMEHYCFLHKTRSSTLIKTPRNPSPGPAHNFPAEQKAQHPYLASAGGLLSTWKTGVKGCSNGVKTSQICAVPYRFCDGLEQKYRYQDCDGDDIPDHVCVEKNGFDMEYVPSSGGAEKCYDSSHDLTTTTGTTTIGGDRMCKEKGAVCFLFC